MNLPDAKLINPPDVTIVMTTWFIHEQRIKVAYNTLKSWAVYLKYDGTIRLHIADDGSQLDFHPEKWWEPELITYSRQERHGVGASLNQGMRKAYESSPIWAYFVDDWELLEPLDISPWVYLLQTREDVGCVRLGPPHPHLRGTIMPYTELWQGWAMKLDRYGLVVGHRPQLFHKRWTDFYGMWLEDLNAQEVERLASVKYADLLNGPDIVYALPHPWWHIDQAVLPSTSGIDPK